MNSSRSVIKAQQVVFCTDDCQVITSTMDRFRELPSVELQSGPLSSSADDPDGPRRDIEAQQTTLLAVAEGQQILRQAREQAAEITIQARLEGLTAAEAEAGQLLLSTKGVYDEVQTWRESVLAGSEKAALDLVAAVAHIIFGESLVLDAETLKAAFARALAEAKPLGDLRIHVHPDDAALLDPHWPQQQSALIGQHLELVPDPAVRRGGCLVEGQYGMVDARVETQMQVAFDAVFAASPMAATPGDAPAIQLPRIAVGAEA